MSLRLLILLLIMISQLAPVRAEQSLGDAIKKIFSTPRPRPRRNHERRKARPRRKRNRPRLRPVQRRKRNHHRAQERITGAIGYSLGEKKESIDDRGGMGIAGGQPEKENDRASSFRERLAASKEKNFAIAGAV